MGLGDTYGAEELVGLGGTYGVRRYLWGKEELMGLRY